MLFLAQQQQWGTPLVLSVAVACIGVRMATGQQDHAPLPWQRPSDPPATRARALLAEMTLHEKVTMLHGCQPVGKPPCGSYPDNTLPIGRLGVPPQAMCDGPQGMRGPAGTSTQWPSGLAMAATFDREAMERWGAGMGAEFAAKGCTMQLGPGVCVARVPTNGRNFEYASGEDPYLGAELIKPAVVGVQRNGVITCVKHYIMNNQETYRTIVSAEVDERTRMEIYHPPFQAAIDAGAMSIMCSYNKINGIWACENNQTQNVELKGYSGFRFPIRSDYGATHSTVESALSGLDQEFPGGENGMFATKLENAVRVGNVSQAVLDDKVYRVLLSMFTQGLFENSTSVPRQNYGQQSANVTSKAHNELARELATASVVLLQNKHAVLPLDAGNVSTIAVIGAPASFETGAPAEGGEPANWPVTGGGGSGSVMPPYRVSVLQAVQAHMKKAGHPARAVVFHNGSDPVAAARVAGKADVAIIVVGVSSQEGSDRTDLMLPPVQSAYVQAAGAAQKRSVVVAVSPGALLTLHCPPPPPPPPPPELQGCTVDRDTDYFNAPCAVSGCGKPAKTLQECCHQCRALSTCHSWTWTGACPDCTPPSFCWHKQNASGRTTHKNLYSGNCSSNATVEVLDVTPQFSLTGGGSGAGADADCVDWADSVSALMVLLMPGQEEGSSAAAVMFGDVNPSGRLPLSFPRTRNELNFTKEMYPGVIDGTDAVLKAKYSEKLNVGYRYYAAKNLSAKFPFGHGLSYTSFNYSDLITTPHSREITVTVVNTGPQAGTTIVQLYLCFPSAAGEPPLQLKGFEKVWLLPGQRATVQFYLTDRDVSTWDDVQHEWAVQTGDFVVMVGESSVDLPLRSTLRL